MRLIRAVVFLLICFAMQHCVLYETMDLTIERDTGLVTVEFTNLVVLPDSTDEATWTEEQIFAERKRLLSNYKKSLNDIRSWEKFMPKFKGMASKTPGEVVQVEWQEKGRELHVKGVLRYALEDDQRGPPVCTLDSSNVVLNHNGTVVVDSNETTVHFPAHQSKIHLQLTDEVLIGLYGGIHQGIKDSTRFYQFKKKRELFFEHGALPVWKALTAEASN